MFSRERKKREPGSKGKKSAQNTEATEKTQTSAVGSRPVARSMLKSPAKGGNVGKKG